MDTSTYEYLELISADQADPSSIELEHTTIFHQRLVESLYANEKPTHPSTHISIVTYKINYSDIRTRLGNQWRRVLRRLRRVV